MLIYKHNRSVQSCGNIGYIEGIGAEIYEFLKQLVKANKWHELFVAFVDNIIIYKYEDKS